MINKKSFENKFSRHIGRILTRLEEEDERITISAHEFVKGELWLLCQDLIVMLEMDECNDKQKTNTE